MASPLAAMNMARYGGVTFMPPVRAAPPRRTPRTARTNRGGSLLDRARDREAQAEWAAERGLPQQQGAGLGGLGWVIGGLGRLGMGALSVLDYPRAAIVSGTRELLDTDAAEAFNRALAGLPGVDYSPIQAEDADASWSDFWNQMREHKGFGELIVEPAMGEEGTDRGIWTRRGFGLAGDIASDPFTYMLGGTRAVQGTQARADYLNKLLDAQQAAGRDVDLVDDLAAQWARRSGGASAELTAAANQARSEAAAVGARLGGPEALERIGRQGVNVANPEQLAAMGIDPHAIRFGGRAIPFTEGLSSGISRTLGPVKQGVSQLPGASALRSLRTPRGVLGQDLRPAIERIVTGQGGLSMEQALRTLALNQMQRGAKGAFRGPAMQIVENFAEEVKDYTPEQRAALIRQAEEEGAENIMTTVGPQMREAAAAIGVDLPELQGAAYVMPHALSREAFNWMNKLRRGENPLLDSFKLQAGIRDQDLLEEGGFLQRRGFRPNPDGSPKTYAIGDQEIEISTGSLSELEDKLGGLLRSTGFKGRLYETDPVEAWRRYINATERDVAKRYSAIQGAAQGFPGLHQAGQAPGTWDPFGRRIEMQPAAGSEEARYMAAAADRPRPADNEFFEMVPDQPRTKRRNRELSKKKGTQRELLAEWRQEGLDQRERMAGELDELAAQVWDPVGEAKAAAREAQRSASARVFAAVAEGEGINISRADYQQAISEVNAEIRRLNAQIGGLTSGVGRSVRAESKELLDTIKGQLDEAIERRNVLSDAFQQAQQRNVRAAETAATDATRLRQTRIDEERFRLEREEVTASENLKQAENWARREAQAKAKASKSGRRYISPEVNAQAEARFRELAAGQGGQEYLALRNEVDRLTRARADALDAAENYDAEVRELRGQARGRQELRDRITWLENGATTKRNTADRIQAQLVAVRHQRNQHEMFKLSTIINDFKAQEDRLQRWAGSVRPGITGGERQQVDVVAARTRAVAAKNAREEFEQAALEEARRPAAFDRPTTLLDEAEQAELAKARKVLAEPKVRDYIVERGQLGTLQDQLAKAEADLAALSPRAKAQARKLQDRIDKINARIDELSPGPGRSKRTINRATQAEATVERLTSLNEQRLAAQGVETGPTRLPFFENLDVEQRAAVEQARNIEGRTQETDALFMPRIAQAEADVVAAREGMVSAEQQAAGVAIERAREAMPLVRAKQGRIEELVDDKGLYQQVDDQLAAEHGVQQQNYVQAMQDQEAARVRHEEITNKVKGADLHKPVSAQRIFEESKRKAAPTKTDIERVIEGALEPYEAQPLRRTVDDVRKIIETNPTGDPNMNRIEAVLESHEQALANLTTEIDVKAHQLDKIVTAANKGELAPVLKGQLRSGFRYVWEGGDYVVAKDLQRIYFNVAEQLDSKLFGRAFTAFTNFFKTYATLSPGFHVRNAISAIFMNSADGVPLREQMAALRLWRQYANAEDPLAWMASRTPAERAAFHAAFASGAGGQFTEAGVSELRTGGTRFMERLFANKLTKGSQKIGQDWVEGPVRLALGLNTTRAGGTFNEALNRITRIHFDYGQVSKFDETMKRIIPFWTFMSRNIPLQFTQMWTKPKMYLRYQSFARNLTMGAEEVPFMPNYIEFAGGLAPGVETPEGLPGAAAGMPVVLQPGLPHLQMQEDLRRAADALSGNNPGQLVSDVNPFFTAAPEYLLGRDFFTGRTYGPEDVTEAKGTNLLLAPMLALIGAAKRGPDGKMYVEDKAINSLRGINPILDRQMRLLPQASGGEGGDRQLESILRFLGAPIRTISEDQRQAEAAGQYYDRLDEARRLRAMGG